MQQIIVFTLAGIALFYLAYRFLSSKNSDHCDSCDYSKPKKQ